jgi:hypothetical protein
MVVVIESLSFALSFVFWRKGYDMTEWPFANTPIFRIWQKISRNVRGLHPQILVPLGYQPKTGVLALVGKIHNPILRQMAARLAERGLTGMSAVAALMRKLLQSVYGVLKSERPFDPDYAVYVQVTA